MLPTVVSPIGGRNWASTGSISREQAQQLCQPPEAASTSLRRIRTALGTSQSWARRRITHHDSIQPDDWLATISSGLDFLLAVVSLAAWERVPSLAAAA